MFDFFGISIIILWSIMFNMESKTKGTPSTEIRKGKFISKFSVMTDLLYCLCLWELILIWRIRGVFCLVSDVQRIPHVRTRYSGLISTFRQINGLRYCRLVESTLLIKDSNFWQFHCLRIYWFIFGLINWMSLQILRLIFDAYLAVSILIMFLTRRLQTTFLKDFKKISFETPVSHINENMKLLDKFREKKGRKIGEKKDRRKNKSKTTKKTQKMCSPFHIANLTFFLQVGTSCNWNATTLNAHCVLRLNTNRIV